MINVDDFFCFLGLAFLRKKIKTLLYIDLLLHRVIAQNKTLNTQHDFAAHSKPDAFKIFL